MIRFSRLPRHLRWLLLLGVVVLLLNACAAAIDRRNASSSRAPNNYSNSDGGSEKEFCGFYHELNEAAARESFDASDAEKLAFLRSFEPRLDQFVKNSPSEAKPSVKNLVDRIRGALKTGDAQVLTSDEVLKNIGAIDEVCGLNPPIK